MSVTALRGGVHVLRAVSRLRRSSAPVSSVELSVLEALADRSDACGRCWPSIATIAADVRITDRTARRAVRRLESLGLVAVAATFDDRGSQRATTYTILVARLLAAADAHPRARRGSPPPDRMSASPPDMPSSAPGQQSSRAPDMVTGAPGSCVRRSSPAEDPHRSTPEEGELAHGGVPIEGGAERRSPVSLDEPLPPRFRKRAEAIIGRAGARSVVDVTLSWLKYVAWCVEQARPLSEPRWACWVADDCKRGLAGAEPAVEPSFYQEGRVPGPDEEFGDATSTPTERVRKVTLPTEAELAMRRGPLDALRNLRAGVA